MKKWLLLSAGILMFSLTPLTVHAGESEVSYLLQQYNMGQIEQELTRLFPNQNISFGDLFWNAIQGKMELNLNLIIENVLGNIKNEFLGMKGIFTSILILGIISALFANLSKAFQSHQIADISFYFLYLLIIIILLRTFAGAYAVASEVITNIVLFMKLLIPTYCIAVGMASGTTTAIAFYQLIMLAIYGVQSILLSLLLPLTYSYAYLGVLNGLMGEERLNDLLELVKKGIKGVLKTILGAVAGISILQTMITPVIDNLKASAVQKTIAMIPGLGGLTNSVTEMVFGSAVLIKNSIGVVLLLFLIILCAVPLLKILMMGLLLKGSAAIIGIVSDKRITLCVNQVGDAAMLLLNVFVTTAALFMITVGIVAAATNRGFG